MNLSLLYFSASGSGFIGLRPVQFWIFHQVQRTVSKKVHRFIVCVWLSVRLFPTHWKLCVSRSCPPTWSPLRGLSPRGLSRQRHSKILRPYSASHQLIQIGPHACGDFFRRTAHCIYLCRLQGSKHPRCNLSLAALENKKLVRSTIRFERI